MKEKGEHSLLDRWKARQQKTRVPSISKADSQEPFVLSHGQHRLWLLQQLNPNNPFYNYSEAYVLRGSLDIASLQTALQKVYDCHDILRTVYKAQDDLPVAVVLPSTPLDFETNDISLKVDSKDQDRIAGLLLADAMRPFDLENGPLLRCSLYRLSEDHHILLLGLHHIAIDKWSMRILRQQLATCYVAFSEGKEPSITTTDVQYQDYAFWQRRHPVGQEHIDFWLKELSGDIPVLSLPKDFHPPSKPSYKGAFNRRSFSPELSGDILKLALKLNCTPYVLLLSVYYLLLYRYSGQKDILVGSPISVRNQKELDNLIGFFINTIVLRTNIARVRLFTELVEAVKSNVLKAFSHRQVPFDELVKALNPERGSNLNPFFNVMFLYNAAVDEPDFGSKLEFTEVWFDTKVSKFDLTLHMSEKKGVLQSMFEYSTDVFKPETIDRLQDHFLLLLQAVVKNPSQNIFKVPMLLPFEKKLFFQKGNLDSPKTPYKKGIHEIIGDMALSRANNIAITYKNHSITYGELNVRAESMARMILKTTKGENRIVGLLVERSAEMIIGILAILKAGCAYLPLDPEYPEDRLRFMINDTDAPLVVTDEVSSKLIQGFESKIISLSEKSTSELSKMATLPEVKGTDTAYIIYTSGSSGKPKGVPISHKNIMISTLGRNEFYDENPDAFLLMSSISFDSSKAGIFWTLCTGGNLVISEKMLEQDVDRLAQTIEDNKVSHTLMLPSLYRVLLEHVDRKMLASLHTVIVAGEACSTNLCDKHFSTLPKTSLYNEYGPTEATVWCIAHKITKDEGATVPIGKPVANAQVYLLNEEMTPVPFGASGEIYIGGPGLSGRYWGRDDLTSKAYFEHPFDDTTGSKLYKTGDLGRYNSKGQIEFLGRIDAQVKLRGFRIELEEVEQVVLEIENVQEAAVLVVNTAHKDDYNSTKLLIAYVTVDGDFDHGRALSFIKAHLPKHMVPNRLIRLEQFPKLPNGKIDRKRLESMPLKGSENQGKSEVRLSETEKNILDIWESVLGFEGLSAHDNFFEIGGDSIMTIQIIAKARKMGMAISPNQIFEYQTASELASFVDGNLKKEDQWDYLVPLRKAGAKTPLFCIHAGGGHVFFYNGLTDHLDADIPIYALQPSGLYGNKKMHVNVNAMAKEYLRAIRQVQPTGPYNILVYCFGAAVGNEMAILLEQMNQEINLIVIDTMTAPAVLNTPRRLKIRAMSFMMRFLRSPFATLKGMAIARYSIWRMKWRSNFGMEEETKELEKLRMNLMKLSQSYKWKPYKGNTSLILTEKDHGSLNKETVRSWQEIAKNDIRVFHTAGSHRVLFEEPYIKETAATIEKCMLE